MPARDRASLRLDFIACDNLPVSLPSPLIVVGVGANPDPVDPTLNICPESTVTIANADRPELPELLEVKRRVTGVGFQKSEALVRQLSRLGRQCLIHLPELWRSDMPQNSRAFPAS